jgi:hypothetical protein
MTSLDAAHEDVAAYALNLMTPEEAWRFELHLLTCEQCTTALAEFTPVADVLAEVDAASLMAAGQIFSEGRILDGMLETASKQRSRTRALRLVSAAAAVVVVVIISVLTAAVGWGGIWPGSKTPGNQSPIAQSKQPGLPGQTRKPDPSQPQDTGSGVCAGISREQNFTAKDSTTGVSAKITVSCENWGTPVVVNLSNIVGPMSCRLIVHTKDGKDIKTQDWDLLAGGFGTSEQPKPASFGSQSSAILTQIASFTIMKIGPGEPQRLVTVSTNK